MWTIVLRGGMIAVIFIAACDGLTGNMPSLGATIAFTISGGWLLEMLSPSKTREKVNTDLLALSDGEISDLAAGKKSFPR